jgi:two-component system, chemotaxis family, sensor kinase CheA
MSDEMDEIWALYADDGAQALDAMEIALDALGAGPAAATDPNVAAFFRAVHTFKGNSRVLGLAVVESRAHYAEDLIGLVRDQGVPWDGEIRDILLMAADTLRVMLEETAASRADVDPAASEPLMHRLKDKIARCTGAAPEAAAAPEPAPEPEPEPAAAPRKVKARKTAEPPAEAEVAVQPAPVAPPPPAPKPVAKKPSDAPRLADDPTYRAIFQGMANDCLAKLRQAMGSFSTDPDAARALARREADGLCHAARQMGLEEWEAALSDYLSDADGGIEATAQLVLRLEELSDAETGTSRDVSAGQGEEEVSFFDALREPLDRIARYGTDFACGDTPDPDGLAHAVEAVKAVSEPQGFVRVVEAADQLLDVDSAVAFRNAELRLYEELGAVEAIMPEAARAAGLSPRGLVQVWCAEHVFDTLGALEHNLNRLRDPETEDRDEEFLAFDRLMRLVRHACAHYQIETAGQLALTLVDLFSRTHTSGKAPDAILNHIARGFIDTIELVFDALHQGETPDTASLDKLFEEAANVAFVKDGLVTASAIERRLGLPKEFHRVLSPESVRTAGDALEQGMEFYVLRTDINTDEHLAEQFIDWLSSGQAKSITNVTVFEGQKTLFDFLIATALDEPSLSEVLARLDPSLRKLVLLRHLKPTREVGSLADEALGREGDGASGLSQQPGVSAEMLESLGEIAASQSMVSHILTELADADLMDSIDTILRTANADMRRVRTQVRALLGDFTARLQAVSQLESQLVGQLAQLQEETVEIRSRSIDTILRPLETFVQTYSRRNRREARFSHTGGEITLDITILDNLRKLLRSLVMLRLEQSEQAPSSIHITFQRDEERVLAVFEDDGGALEDPSALQDVQAGLHKMGGDLRRVALPGKGMRFHISIPLAMVVLEGMVVGVQGVRYVMPVDAIRMILQPENDVRIRISAAEGREMLRIAENELVTVTSLGGAPQGAARTEGQRRGVYVVLGTQGRSVAVPVDELIGQQLVLLRPLRGVLSRIENMTGIALLAGGDVGMVVSANMLCAANGFGGGAGGGMPSLRM